MLHEFDAIRQVWFTCRSEDAAHVANPPPLANAFSLTMRAKLTRLVRQSHRFKPTAESARIEKSAACSDLLDRRATISESIPMRVAHGEKYLRPATNTTLPKAQTHCTIVCMVRYGEARATSVFKSKAAEESPWYQKHTNRGLFVFESTVLVS